MKWFCGCTLAVVDTELATSNEEGTGGVLQVPAHKNFTRHCGGLKGGQSCDHLLPFLILINNLIF